MIFPFLIWAVVRGWKMKLALAFEHLTGSRADGGQGRGGGGGGEDIGAEAVEVGQGNPDRAGEEVGRRFVAHPGQGGFLALFARASGQEGGGQSDSPHCGAV